MIVISLRFLAGRYHATPWGRHVNEGAVEWPPSPWRLLRALVATWKRTSPDLSQQEVEPIFRTLATPPEFVLPPASIGHSRHFMPWYKKGPDDRTLVFDAFVVVPRDAPVIIRWPQADLDDRQRTTLVRILTNLNTLGRSESWCEAVLVSGPGTGDHLNAHPERIAAPLAQRTVAPEVEIVRVLCADPVRAFTKDHVTTVAGHKGDREAVSVYDPNWNLCVETLELHKDRWSDPPGSQWVQYGRPRDCFKLRPRTHRARSRPPQRPSVARFALDSTVLPMVTDTLPVAEAARRALLGIYGRLAERDGARGRSEILSGKDERGDALAHPVHGHAYYLPTDEDGDGRLEHLTIVARDGFGRDERRAIDGLRQLNLGDGRHPLRLLLLGLGPLEEYTPGPLRAGDVWVSATPYIATRYAKTRGRDRVDLGSAVERAAFLASDLRDQLAVLVPDPAGDARPVVIEPLLTDETFRIAGRWRPIQFKRSRSKWGDDGGLRLTGAFRLTFPGAIPGPIAAGHSAHFGMGLFVPADASATRATATVRDV